MKDTMKERTQLKRQVRAYKESIGHLKVRLANLSMSYMVKKRFQRTKEAEEAEAMREDVISVAKAQIELSIINTAMLEMGM